MEELKPHKTIYPSKNLDQESIATIKKILPNTVVDCSNLEEGGSQADIDGYIVICDSEGYANVKISVQVKHLTDAPKNGDVHYDIPSQLYGYAGIHKGEVVVFIAADPENESFYWNAIDLEAVKRIEENGKIQKTYRHHFSDSEVCTTSNVNNTLNAWRRLYGRRMESIKDDRYESEHFTALQKSYFNVISSEIHGVEDSHIERREVEEIIAWISSPISAEGKLCLLVGNAGVGKSAIMKEVIASVNDGNLRYLCIKADTINEAGNNVTLERIRDTIEYYSHEAEKVILFVDQIDALSPCIVNDRSRLNILIAILSSLSEWKNVKSVVSCRTYDLDYDADLFRLKETAKVVNVGKLTEEEVSSVLVKIDPGLREKLNSMTLELLRTAQYLDTFCFLYKQSKSNLDFSNPVELYDALIGECINAASNFAKPGIEPALFTIAESVRKSDTLRPYIIPSSEEQKSSFAYLASCGLIITDNHTVSFFHQSFYEYILARWYTSTGRSLFDDVREEFQGLEVRPILKSVLEYKRGHKNADFVEEVRAILSSDEIRLHIKLLAISVLAYADTPIKSEKSLVKEFCSQDERLLVYFLRGVQGDKWFHTVRNIVKPALPGLQRDSLMFFPIVSFLSRFAFCHPYDVYTLIDTIKDDAARIFSISYILRSHNDYSEPCVLKAYREVQTQNAHFSVDVVKDAFLTNVKFALEETGKLLLNYLLNEKKESNLDGYEFAEVLCPFAADNHSKDFLLTLHDVIIKTIEHSTVNVDYGFSISKVFSKWGANDYSQKILRIYEDLLTGNASDGGLVLPLIKDLMALNNETSVSMAFETIAVCPEQYDEIIRSLLGNDATIESYMAREVKYFFLTMLRKWYDTLDDVGTVWFQNRLLSFKSTAELGAFKDKKLHQPSCLHPWNDKWDLICNALPETGLIPAMKKCSQEMLRRLGKRNVVERPDHSTPMAFYCGGVTTDEVYANWPVSNWMNSFLKLKESGYIDLRVHADKFRKCVSGNPYKFKAFVSEISGREDVREMYKVAGIEGLLTGGLDPGSLWPLTEPYISVEYALSNAHHFSSIAEFYVKEENAHLDTVLNIVKSVAAMPVDETDCSVSTTGDSTDLDQRARGLLEHAVNSIQGSALELLIKICSIPGRKAQAYDNIAGLEPSLPVFLKALPLHYLYVEGPYDEDLYFPLMKNILSGMGAEALCLRGDAIQWFFYHKNAAVKGFIDRVEQDPSSHMMLVQIYFYGLASKRNREDCRTRLEKILLLDNEKVISKLVEISMKSYRDPAMTEYSREFLTRFASDDRESVVSSYCWYCKSLPVEAFDFYCDIAGAWPGKKHRDVHSQLEYVGKCVSRYPELCYLFIRDQRYWEIDGQWIADDDVVRTLLQIYNKLKETENEDLQDDIMDLFDEYIYRGNRIMDDALAKMD